MFSQFEGAEILAEKYEISREEMDAFAVASHAKAQNATTKGYFAKEIVPLTGTDKQGNEVVHDRDEGIRPQTNMASLAKLKSVKAQQSKGKHTGVITAGLASQICDGAAAILICNEAGLAKLGVKPKAKIISLALAGDDPVEMLGGPIPATKSALKRSGLSLKDMDLYEVNEAFCSVPLASKESRKTKQSGGSLGFVGFSARTMHPPCAPSVRARGTKRNRIDRHSLVQLVTAGC